MTDVCPWLRILICIMLVIKHIQQQFCDLNVNTSRSDDDTRDVISYMMLTYTRLFIPCFRVILIYRYDLIYLQFFPCLFFWKHVHKWKILNSTCWRLPSVGSIIIQSVTYNFNTHQSNSTMYCDLPWLLLTHITNRNLLILSNNCSLNFWLPY